MLHENTKQRKTKIHLILLTWLCILGAAMLACNMPTGAKTPVTTPIPISTQAIATLQQDIYAAATALMNQQTIQLTLDEVQLTSFVALETQSMVGITIEQPQVLLRNGEVSLQGQVNQSGINVSFTVNLTPTVTKQGRLDLAITSATLGPLPMPDNIRNQFSDRINQAMLSMLGAKIDNLFIDQITISDGVMTISGHPRG